MRECEGKASGATTRADTPAGCAWWVALALLGGCDFGVCPSLSGGLEVGLADVVADGLVDDPQGITQGWWRRWAICGQEWGQEPVVELGVEDREAPALGGEHVGVAAGQTADEALAAQAGQVVAHLVCRVGGAEQGGDLGAKAPVGEPDHAGEQDRQGAGQGHDPGIAEAQRSGAASRLASWLCDPRKGWARKDTARAGPFSVQQPPVGRTRSGLERIQMLQAPVDPQVGGRVADSLHPDRAALLEGW